MFRSASRTSSAAEPRLFVMRTKILMHDVRIRPQTRSVAFDNRYKSVEHNALDSSDHPFTFTPTSLFFQLLSTPWLAVMKVLAYVALLGYAAASASAFTIKFHNKCKFSTSIFLHCPACISVLTSPPPFPDDQLCGPLLARLPMDTPIGPFRSATSSLLVNRSASRLTIRPS